MRKCRHVNRRGVRASEEGPRADVIQPDCIVGRHGDNQQEVRGHLTRGNDTARGIDVHIGIGSGTHADGGNHNSQLSLDIVLSGNLESIVSQVVEILGPYLRRAIADSTVNVSPQQGIPSGTLAIDSRSAPREVVLSAGARSLLKTIVDISNRCDLQEHPDEAWISFSSWFIMTRQVERHRADAESLILELTNAGFVEVLKTPKRKRYKATVSGCRYLKSLKQA